MNAACFDTVGATPSTATNRVDGTSFSVYFATSSLDPRLSSEPLCSISFRTNAFWIDKTPYPIFLNACEDAFTNRAPRDKLIILSVVPFYNGDIQFYTMVAVDGFRTWLLQLRL